MSGLVEPSLGKIINALRQILHKQRAEMYIHSPYWLNTPRITIQTDMTSTIPGIVIILSILGSGEPRLQGKSVL